MHQDSTPYMPLCWPETFEDAHVCFFAIYAPEGEISRSTQQYLQTLADHGIIIIACVVVKRLDMPIEQSTLDMAKGIFIRENFGMDFAIWAKALNHDSKVWSARSITFTNDSVFVLPDLVSDMLTRVENSPADVVFLTESRQIQCHGQSYYFTFKNKALVNASLRNFWENMEPQAEKRAVIELYETRILQLSQHAWGCEVEKLYPLEQLFQDNLCEDFNINITHTYWLYLVWLGFPFVKVELLRDNPTGARIFGWQRIFETYGADVAAAKAHLEFDRGCKPTLPAALGKTDGKAITFEKNTKTGLLLILSKLNKIRLKARRRTLARITSKG